MVRAYSNEELEGFRQRLLARKRQLWYNIVESLRDEVREDYQAGLNSAPQDDPEKALMDLIGDTDMLLIENRRDQLSGIEEALQRIDEGSYGLCVDCGEKIPPKRLEVLPFAVRCLEDQEREEGRVEMPSM